MMPSKSRKEWAQLISGEITPQLHCLALQFALSRVRTAYKYNRITMEDAINEVYAVGEKYHQQVEADFKAIFR